MKTILMTMTALAGLSVAIPASAQPWNGQHSRTGELQVQLDEGMRSGAISRSEARPLRTRLSQLVSLERQYSRNGFSGRENAALRQRSNMLDRQIRAAARSGGFRDRHAGMEPGDYRPGMDRGRPGMDRGDHKDGAWDGRGDGRLTYGADSRFDGPNRGDRFAGDARVGHRSTARMIALPEQYRDQFRDSDDVYYRYDAGRIYRINRSTDMVLGLFDIGR